jgi:hypothetical protein
LGHPIPGSGRRRPVTSAHARTDNVIARGARSAYRAGPARAQVSLGDGTEARWPRLKRAI